MSKLTEIKQHMETCCIEEYERLYFLLDLLEEKDKAIEWANRIIGSGLDIGAELRYDPRQWLIDYHTSSNNEGETI